MKWYFRLLFGAVIACVAWVMIAALFFLPQLLLGEYSMLEICLQTDNSPLFRAFISVLIGALSALLIKSGNSLDDIKLRTAGSGQYGTARWASASEKKKMYPRVAIGKAAKSGIVVGYDAHHFSVDTSDHNLMVLAPPGAGKTKCLYIPSILYNCNVNRNTNGGGASLLIVDVKGEEYIETAAFAREAGYTVRVLDYRHPLESDCNNMLYAVNQYMDKMRAAETAREKILCRARAERYAKILSSAIMNTSAVRSIGGSDSSEFFNNTAEGLITSIVLLVSEYGLPSERHLPSVFRLLIELNGLVQNEDEQSDTVQKSRLKELLSRLPEENRSKLFAGASINADVRTSMNIFSSAMAKLLNFVDNELEQMICEQSAGFSAEEFVAKPTIIYLIVPDEDSTRHLFSSLFIRQMLTDLISYGNEQHDLALPRKVIFFWDEFGNSPAIKDLASQFTAARSRGIRLVIALQSLAQLNERYGRDIAKIIRDATQMTMFSYTAPTAEDTARELSHSLGKYTTISGSSSTSEKNNSQSRQLIGRDLLMPDEIARLPFGAFVIMKSGSNPVKVMLKPFMLVWKDIPKCDERPAPRDIIDIDVLTEQKILARIAGINTYEGMLDDDEETEKAEIISAFSEDPPPPPKKKGFKRKTE